VGRCSITEPKDVTQCKWGRNYFRTKSCAERYFKLW